MSEDKKIQYMHMFPIKIFPQFNFSDDRTRTNISYMI